MSAFLRIVKSAEICQVSRKAKNAARILAIDVDNGNTLSAISIF